MSSNNGRTAGRSSRGRVGGSGRGRGRGRGGRERGRGNNNNDGEPAAPRLNPPSRRGGRANNGRTAGGRPTQPLENGQRGAEIHTVREADRIRWTEELIALRESHWELQDAPPTMEFPATLTNTERKFLHHLAGQLGLQSKSMGLGDHRRITIYPSQPKSRSTVQDAEDISTIPLLMVGQPGVDALRRHFQKFPPTPSEQIESRETGAALLQASREGNTAAIAQALNQMGLMDSQKRDSRQYRHRAKPIDLERRSRNHAEFQRLKRSNAQAYRDMLQRRSELPAYKHQAEVVQKVADHPVTIVSGDTGCGKTTQVPQFILDANPTCNIVVTQPRRIAAISISERVAYEQLQPDTGGQVGYKVRLENSHSDKTQLIFMTPGILLRQLQSDPYLQDYTHIMMDEIHERDQYQEFLLVVLRDLLPLRPDLRLVLMSATLQLDQLYQYFMDDAKLRPALVEMEGRMFQVQEFFLEQVLDMTGYITVADDGEECAPVLTDDQLEAELARFIHTGSTTTAAPEPSQVYHPKLNCVLCRRRNFKDAKELGAHLAICNGGGEDDEKEQVEAIDNTKVAPSFGSGGRNDNPPEPAAPVSLEGIEFEEYNVDEEVAVEDYDYEFRAQEEEHNSNGPEESDGHVEQFRNVEKWDGQSPFGNPRDQPATENDAEELVLTKKEEAILKQYQSSHDDEQIDTSLLLETIRYINESSHGTGAVLVFLPGWQEISEMIVILENTPPFSNRNKFWILPLHSGIPSKDQRRVLQTPPTGVRKIVLSTNIAETSLTINDVSFVVDTGRAKEKNYDPHLKTSTLHATWISAASAKQRKGRAGRTKRGVCFHLFSQRRHLSLRPFAESELLRTPLEEMCLLCKQLGLAPGGSEDKDGVPAFLGKAMSAPHVKSVINALELLVDLGAMQPETNNLTNLGECLAQLSLEPRVGKMTVWSYLLGCSRVTADMAVAMSYKSPFVLPPPHQRKAADEAKVRLSKASESDQLTVHYALEMRAQNARDNSRQNSMNEFCRRNFLSTNTIQMIAEIRKNLTRELSMLGFPSPAITGQSVGNNRRGNVRDKNATPYHNRHDNDNALWQAAIAAGLYPNVAFRMRGETNFSTMANQKVKIHVSSVNAIRGQPLNAKCCIPKGQLEFICFGEMVKGSAQFFTVNQTTHLASALPLMLLCGTALHVRPVRGGDTAADAKENKGRKGGPNGNQPKDQKLAILTLDNWIVFLCDAEIAANLVILRTRLETAFWNAIANPKHSRRSSSNSSSQGRNFLARLDPQEKDALEILGPLLQSAYLHSKAAKSRSPPPGRR